MRTKNIFISILLVLLLTLYTFSFVKPYANIKLKENDLKMVDVKIYVMTHKKYNLLDNDLYTPLFVGAEGKEETFGYLRDDVGDNISSKNSNYSEITGLYWIWKIQQQISWD